MIKSIIILMLIACCSALFVYSVVLKNRIKEAEQKAIKVLENAQKEPIRVERFTVEPVVLTAQFAVDYTMLNHLDEDDIHGMMVERFARDFGNYIVENPNLYFMTDCDNHMTMRKVFEARVRIVPWK